VLSGRRGTAPLVLAAALLAAPFGALAVKLAPRQQPQASSALAAQVTPHGGDADGFGASGDEEIDVHVWADEDQADEDGEGAVEARFGRQSSQGSVRLQGPGGKCLNFIHIPKTAGVSISDIGEKIGKSWGVRNDDMRCYSESTCMPGYPPRCCCCTMPDREVCSRWHVPPSLDTKIAEYYGQCESFCVVRDPVARYRSALVWNHRHQCSRDDLTVDTLNDVKWYPYTGDCHYIPQMAYVGCGPKETRYCKHVLRFESLERDFNGLMADFGIPARLTLHSNAHNCSVELRDDVKEAVRSYYAEDYAELGY